MSWDTVQNYGVNEAPPTPEDRHEHEPRPHVHNIYCLLYECPLQWSKRPASLDAERAAEEK